jgi:hypothetical protein
LIHPSTHRWEKFMRVRVVVEMEIDPAPETTLLQERIEHELIHVVEVAVIMNHTVGFDTHLPHTITPTAVGIDGKHMYPIERSDLM